RKARGRTRFCDFELVQRHGPVLVVLKVSSARDPLVLPPWDGALLKSRSATPCLGRRSPEGRTACLEVYKLPSWFLRSSSSTHMPADQVPKRFTARASWTNPAAMHSTERPCITRSIICRLCFSPK